MELLEANNRIEQLKREKDLCFEMFKGYAVEMAGANDEISKLNKENARLKTNIDTNEKNIALKDKKITELNNVVETLEGNLKDIEEEYSTFKNQSEKEFECRVSEVSKGYDSKIEELNREKDMLLDNYNQLLGKYNSLKEEKETLENTDSADITNIALEREKGLNVEIDNLREEIDQLRVELSDKEEVVLRADEENKRLKDRVEEANIEKESLRGKLDKLSIEKGTKEYKIKFNRLSRAKIITVLGASGSGITTVAVSIMKELGKLGKKVCYLDMDLVMPDSEGFFGKNPVVSDNMTSLELCIGHDLLQENIIDVSSGGFISGVRAEHKDKWKKIDFQKVLNDIERFGYEYIVIDLGEFGIDKDNNNLMKAVCDISNNVFIVCENDKFRCSKLFRALKQYNIDGKLIVNKCVNSRINPLVKKMSNDAICISFEVDLYNMREPLSVNGMTKNKLVSIMREVK